MMLPTMLLRRRRLSVCPDYERYAGLSRFEPRCEQLDDQLLRRLRRCATRHMPGTRKYKIEASVEPIASAEHSHSNAAA
jgi:hypothetical protein